jgi:uncharacterized protein (TIGR03643 family)
VKRFTESDLSGIVEAALSDKISFETIFKNYGIKENQVKRIMQSNLRKGSYLAWRKRVFRKPEEVKRIKEYY